MPCVTSWCLLKLFERKCPLAKRLCGDMKKFLNAPVMEVFYLNLDGAYANGEEKHRRPCYP